MNFYIYILYSKSIDKYYVGFSNDPWKRLEQHLNNDPDKFTGKAKDWVLSVAFWVSHESKDAIKIEKLIDPEFQPDGILAQLVRVQQLRG